MAKETLEELRRQEAAAKDAVEHARRGLEAAMYRLSLVQMRISNHREYTPRKPEPFGRPHGMPKELRDTAVWHPHRAPTAKEIFDLRHDDFNM